MKPEELDLVEEKVNERVLRNDPVAWRIMPMAEAKAEGAIALFGEKYGDEVRMLDVGGYSKELCGGLHCSATGDIGLFKIIAESSVAAGVRRIEAVTGIEALRMVREKEKLDPASRRSARRAGSAPARPRQQVQAQVKELKRDLKKARQSSAPSAAEFLKQAADAAGAKVVAARMDDVTADDLHNMASDIQKAAGSAAVALGTVAEGKVIIIVAATKDLLAKGIHAGQIAGAAAKLCGGGGGGKPDRAQAGGKDPSGLDNALAEARRIIIAKLGG